MNNIASNNKCKKSDKNVLNHKIYLQNSLSIAFLLHV